MSFCMAFRYSLALCVTVQSVSHPRIRNFLIAPKVNSHQINFEFRNVLPLKKHGTLRRNHSEKFSSPNIFSNVQI